MPRVAPGWSLDFGLGVAFAAELTTAALLVEVRPHLGLTDATAVFIGSVGLLAWWLRPGAAHAAAGLGWLFINAFVVDSSGTLRWHGTGDLGRLPILTGTAGIVSAIRSMQLSLRWRYRRIPSDWVVGEVEDIDARAAYVEEVGL